MFADREVETDRAMRIYRKVHAIDVLLYDGLK